MSEGQPNVRDDVRHFHVHTCLGSGGFGEVYKATMTSAGGVRHEVAIKVLHEGLDPRSQAVQRLRDEGKLLGVLRHPAILRVHDLVLLDGRVSLVTEYIEGGDLDLCFLEGNITTRALVDVIGQVAAALDVAWNTQSPDGEGKLQLVHRDVKPANIRVGRHGEVKLLDFGIAKAAGVKREAQTQAKALIGSYLYMSPERLDRKEGFLPGGDIYALGAVLYEGVTGERLFGDLDLKEQYKLSWDAGQHDLFIKQKVDAIADLDERVLRMMSEMLSHDEEDRPEPAKLATYCESLADDLPGKSLRQWCRIYDWPKPSDALGVLGGRTITETAFTTGTITSATLEAMRRPDAKPDGTMVGFLDGASTIDQAGSQVPDAPVVTELQPATEERGNRKVVMAGAAALLIGTLGIAAASVGIFVWSSSNSAVEAPIVENDGVADVAPEPAPDPAPVAAPQPAPQPNAEVAAAPEPAPVAAPAPAPSGTAEVAPEPDPEVIQVKAPEPEVIQVTAPAPKPKPAPKAAMGTVNLSGSVPVELRGNGRVFPPGQVPPGGYEMWANFGDGFQRATFDVVNVTDGGTVNLKCSTLKQTCQVL